MALCSFDPDEFDRSRQFLLDRRCERNHPKRHRTQKRAKRLSKMKRERIKAKNAHTALALHRHHALVRAYWAGEIDRHPLSPQRRS